MNAQTKQVATVEPSPSTSIVAIIERIATDPNLPIERMERLLDMQERVMAKQAETDFNQAMSAAQSEMGRVSADATNPQTRSKYASYPQLDKALRPIYTKHGFALSFDEGQTDKPEHVRVICYVTHRGGHSRTYHRDMPADGKGAKGGDVMTKTHAAGAAQSYGMRYLLKGIFNIAVGEDDNDGNAVTPPVTAEQAAKLDALITEIGVDRAAFLKYLRIAELTELPAKNFGAAVKALEKKRNQKGNG